MPASSAASGRGRFSALCPQDGLAGRSAPEGAVAEDGEDRVTVACVDVPVDLLPRRLCEGVEPAQLLTDRDDEAVGERRQREDTENAEKGEEAKLADPAPWPARSRRLGAFSAKRHGRGGF